MLNAILWKLRTGAPWRDLPERYGLWKTAHERLRLWTADGAWQKILDEVIVKDGSHSAGARKKGAAPPPSRRSRSTGKDSDAPTED